MIDLNAFYTDNRYLILCLAFAILMVALYAFYRTVWLYPEWLNDDDKDGGVPTFPKTSPPLDSQVYDSGTIQQFINERYKLQADIMQCEVLNKMGNLYWKIEELEDWYRDRVPDGKLIEHITGLYDFHAIRAKQIQQSASYNRIKEAPVSTGS